MLIISDSDSGEIIREVSRSDLLDFTQENYAEYLNSTGGIYMPSFSKIDVRVFIDVKCNPTILNRLISMVKKSDGILRYKGKIVTSGNISKCVGSDRKTVNKALKNLVEQDVIKKCKVGRVTNYRFNPYLCSRGRRVKKELYEMFKESRWNRATNKHNNIEYFKAKENEQDGFAS